MSAHGREPSRVTLPPERFTPPLSDAELWKANLLASYTRRCYMDARKTCSWPYLADGIRANAQLCKAVDATKWIRDIERCLPLLHESFEKAVVNTWAAKVLWYLGTLLLDSEHKPSKVAMEITAVSLSGVSKDLSRMCTDVWCVF